jgi:uncharacterized protein YkwD
MARMSLALAAALAGLGLFVPAGAGAATAAHAHTRHAAACGRASHVRSRHAARRRAHCPARHRVSHRGRGHGNAALPAGALPDAQGHCHNAALAPSVRDVPLVRLAVLCLINRERIDRHEAPLRPDGRVTNAAQSHTESMVLGNYFEHDGPQGDTPLTRLRRTGYIYSSRVGYEIGENIGWGTLWLGTPKAIVAAWMASSGHRANILDPRFRDTGIGVSPHPPGSLAGGVRGGVYTQDFGVIVG